MPIKTFRGKLADGAIDKISLHTNNGTTGYRIKKFQAMTGDAVGGMESASLVAIYKTVQTTASNEVDFSDQTLLAAIDYRQHTNEGYGITGANIIFDQEVFNQDIYITHKDSNTGASMNYYIELEQVTLRLDENTVATLKDIRNLS